MVSSLLWNSALVLFYIQLCLFTGGSCADEGWFWHVTDIHYDFTYHDRQLSCLVNVSNPGQYGDYKCDSPWKLVNSSIFAMAEIKHDVDFLLWTGDTVLHAPDDELSNEINNDIIENVTNVLKSAFSSKPVYATFGNHDYHPSDQFPPGNNQLYNVTLLKWMSWINDTAQDDNFVKGGYYSVKTHHGIRIVALNTNLYYKYNRQVEHETDPADQFHWLNETLSEARTRQEKVIVTAHIAFGVKNPPGKLSMLGQFHSRLVDILQTYADIMVGMHFGHDHADTFKIMLNANGNPAVPVFMAPSVTPAQGEDHNPAIRLVKYDRATGKHLDIEQYYLDLPNANKDTTTNWKLEYRASESYHLTDVTATSLLALKERMQNQKSQEFRDFWTYHLVSLAEEKQKECDQECHAKFICGITELHLNRFTACVQKVLTSASSNLISSMYILLLLLSLMCKFM